MKIAHALVLLLCASALVSCEETVSPTDIPYVERIIVRGVLDTDAPTDSIRFTRTLPVNTEYDTLAAELHDVVGTIESDGESFPLKHIGHGYYVAEGLVPVSGRIYTLRATWHGKSVSASTRVPYPTAVDSTWFTPTVMYYNDGSFSDTVYQVSVRFRPRQGEVYGMSYLIGDSAETRSVYSPFIYHTDVKRWKDTTSDGAISIATENYSGIDFPPPYSGEIRIYAFDEPYYDFYNSYYYGYENDGPFSSGEDHIHWNVQGDVIGLFIGRTITPTPVQ